MIASKPEVFESDVFALQIISKGAFIDTGTGTPGKVYAVEAITVRLNWVALNEWILSEMQATRDCYKDGPDGDTEWEAHKREYKEKRKAFADKVICDLGLDTEKGGIFIRQANSEVFTVVYIWEMTGCKSQAAAQ